MKPSKLLKNAAVIAFAAAVSFSPAVAQQAKGGLYVYHTGPSGRCPGLDWHIVTGPDGSLKGFVSWDQMQHMARLDGMINKNRTFTMEAKEVGGSGREATVSGRATGNNIVAMIKGSGTACDGKELNIPRFAGGLEGGGG